MILLEYKCLEITFNEVKMLIFVSRVDRSVEAIFAKSVFLVT